MIPERKTQRESYASHSGPTSGEKRRQVNSWGGAGTVGRRSGDGCRSKVAPSCTEIFLQPRHAGSHYRPERACVSGLLGSEEGARLTHSGTLGTERCGVTSRTVGRNGEN